MVNTPTKANKTREGFATKRQVVIVHGGDVFDSRDSYLASLRTKAADLERFKPGSDWKMNLAIKLGPEFEVLYPQMPNKNSAQYAEWKIWFQRLAPFLKDGATLIGHSLGGLFLVKYLSEETLPVKIKVVFLIAAPFGDSRPEFIASGFSLPNDISGVRAQTEKIYLYHSKDDPVVLFAELGNYRVRLPSALVRIFKDREHFNQENFPEIVKELKAALL